MEQHRVLIGVIAVLALCAIVAYDIVVTVAQTRRRREAELERQRMRRSQNLPESSQRHGAHEDASSRHVARHVARRADVNRDRSGRHVSSRDAGPMDAGLVNGGAAGVGPANANQMDAGLANANPMASEPVSANPMTPEPVDANPVESWDAVTGFSAAPSLAADAHGDARGPVPSVSPYSQGGAQTGKSSGVPDGVWNSAQTGAIQGDAYGYAGAASGDDDVPEIPLPPGMKREGTTGASASAGSVPGDAAWAGSVPSQSAVAASVSANPADSATRSATAPRHGAVGDRRVDSDQATSSRERSRNMGFAMLRTDAHYRLARLGAEYHVFHDVNLPDSNGVLHLDEFIVSPYGLFIIGFCAHDGRVFGNATSPNWISLPMGSPSSDAQAMAFLRGEGELPQGAELFASPSRRSEWNAGRFHDMFGVPDETVDRAIVFPATAQVRAADAGRILITTQVIPWVRSHSAPVLGTEYPEALAAAVEAYRVD